jgi:hypothetical protein
MLAIAIGALVSCYLSTLWGAPWAPTPLRRVDAMLRLAHVRAGEHVVDLGAGDGRIVIRAVRHFGARATGVELDPIRWLIGKAAIRALGIGRRARIVRANLFTYCLDDADVVTMYLLPGSNRRLRVHLVGQLRPGARVVSHGFPIEGWTPVVTDARRRLYLYEIGRLPETPAGDSCSQDGNTIKAG